MMSTDTISGTIRFHLITLRGAVKLEKAGMKRSRRPSAKQIAIKELSLPQGCSYDDVIAAIGERLGEANEN
jgi:hypothetical protein